MYMNRDVNTYLLSLNVLIYMNVYVFDTFTSLVDSISCDFREHPLFPKAKGMYLDT
jgi:hypothetical protein